jgi:uncharacterized membrane protein (UPF0127 family)
MTYHDTTPQNATVVFPRTNLRVSAPVASTEAERVQGLHGRTSLGPYEGMLFRFPPQPPPIWMTMTKMQIPLDIIFIGNVGKVLTIMHIAHRVAAGRVPPVLGPAVPWVLEVPFGFARRHGLVRGDIVSIS